MKYYIEEHFHTPSAKIYGKKVCNTNLDINTSGNRETAGKSPRVIQQIKPEVKSLLIQTIVLIEKVSDAAKTIVTEDILEAKALHESTKLYGHVQSFSLNPYKRLVYQDSLSDPRLIVTDYLLALIMACIKEF